jgi:hypothetical protein
MDAPTTLLLIFTGILVWLFVTLFVSLLRQKERSPFRTILLIAAPLALLLAAGIWLAS